jgi:kojibiose phosphorylase/nigerose phosphorylase
VHLSQPHLLAMRCTVTASADTELSLVAAIDGDVWDIHGPHYGGMELGQGEGLLFCLAVTQGDTDRVAVCRKNFGPVGAAFESDSLSCGETFTLTLREAVPQTITSLCSVYTTRDTDTPLDEAVTALAGTSAATYEEWLAESNAEWQAVWLKSLVEIDGDEEAETAVNYSLYHLNCVAPRQGQALSIPARGLSGQTYKGAVFWDSELFMLDYFLYCQPEIAESMVRYRIETLDGALKKAAEYGWQGAFYAWESQQGGFDGCSDYNVTDVFTGRPVRTYFRDKQVHISAAVVWAIMHVVRATGN